MKKSKFTILFFTLAIMFLACSKDKTDDNITPFTCEEEVSFQSDIMTIIMSSCATSGCHNQASSASGYNFTAYESIQQHKDIMLKSIRKEPGVTPMPIGQELEQEWINQFECWIEQGAKNN
jgi:hypothetical protein